MQSQQASTTVEIIKNETEGVITDPEKWEPHELMVASIVSGTKAQHCSGISLPRIETLGPDSDSSYCPVSLEPSHIEQVLQGDRFALEIPSENFMSDVLFQKLRKIPPKDRMRALARIMYQEGIPRVIITSPDFEANPSG